MITFATDDANVQSSSDSKSDEESYFQPISAEVLRVDNQQENEASKITDVDQSDPPLVVMDEVSVALSRDRPEGAVFDVVCEDANSERDRIKKFSCNCQHYQQQACCAQFSHEFILN